MNHGQFEWVDTTDHYRVASIFLQQLPGDCVEELVHLGVAGIGLALGENLFELIHRLPKVFPFLVDRCSPDGNVNHLVPTSFLVPRQQLVEVVLHQLGGFVNAGFACQAFQERLPGRPDLQLELEISCHHELVREQEAAHRSWPSCIAAMH